MRLSLALPQYEIDRDPAGPPGAQVMLTTARHAERLGLDGVWLSDHPFAVAPDGSVSGALEPLASAAALGRATERIRVGTLVLAATMRTPSLLAHTVGTLRTDRLTVGVGAGWYEPEHRAFGVARGSYAQRVGQLESALVALSGLGAARPRILAGGSGEPLLDVAARHADEWNVSWDASAETFAALSLSLDRACDRAGRDPSTIARSVGLTLLVGRNEREIAGAVERLRGRASFLAGIELGSLTDTVVSGTPERCAERIASYAANEVVVALLLRDDPEMLELFATEVAPLLRTS